jgi:hypothetical protein
MNQVAVLNDTKELTINEAIELAIKECKDGYAQTYLRALDQAFEEDGLNGFKHQLLYCLSNMGTWRGETARTVKKVMKAYCGIK